MRINGTILDQKGITRAMRAAAIAAAQCYHRSLRPVELVELVELVEQLPPRQAQRARLAAERLCTVWTSRNVLERMASDGAAEDYVLKNACLVYQARTQAVAAMEHCGVVDARLSDDGITIRTRDREIKIAIPATAEVGGTAGTI